MVFQTGISFEKREYHQEEAIRGHIDVDIDQYQAPADGRREDYVCRFKVYGQFSFQQPDFRKSTIPRWKRGRDAIASWQTFAVEGTTCEFTINSRDRPYLLKPGQATRVRSIPFSFQVPGPNLPASFVSTHGRAKLDYIVSATTTGKRGIKHTASNSFLLLPSSTTTTFQLYQHHFNVDIDNGGVTTELTATIRNIITVSYPVQLMQGSMQNLTITLPDERFTLNEVSLRVNSRLSIHAEKSTFAIEEDSIVIPCMVTKESPTSQILSLRVPADLSESFTLTLKRSIAKKAESLQLLFGYSVRTSDGIRQCTSSCEFPVVIIGVHQSPSSGDAGNGNAPPRNPNVETVDTPFPNSNHPVMPLEAGILPDESVDSLQVEIPENPPVDEAVKRSTVRALRGILKKPRRQSRDIRPLEVECDPNLLPQPNGDLNSTAEGIVPDHSSQHSDEVQNPPDPSADQPAKPNTVELSSYKIQRGSLQMAAFDRVLFAKRGAELRNEYMRDFH